MDKLYLRSGGWMVMLCWFMVSAMYARPGIRRLPLQPESAFSVAGAAMVQADSVVYVAGGWEPATAQYSSQILKWDGRNWSDPGTLRQPLAYGVAFPIPGGFIYAGGVNAQGSKLGVDLYQFYSGSLPVVEALPDLPLGLERMAGVMFNNSLYLVGGIADSIPQNTVYQLNLSETDAGWKLISNFPGPPRVAPVLAVARQQEQWHLFLWGGYAPGYQSNAPVVSVDGLRYNLSLSEWTSVLPPVDPKGNILSVGAGNAVALSDTKIVVSGGFDAQVMLKELRRSYLFRGVERWSLLSHYRSRPTEWYRYNSRLLLYDASRNRWKVLLDSGELARTGAAAVKYGSDILIFQGETKPGITSSKVLKVNPTD